MSVELLEDFKHVLPELEKKYERKWENYEVEKAWAFNVHVGQLIYVLQIKIGVFPNFHHYTVKFEVNHGKHHLLQVEEGLKTLF